MSKPVDYCTVEFDFLTGGANSTFMSLTSAQRYAYICAWSYAVHLRKLHLSNYEIENRLAAIYDIDSRTVARMLQECCKDDELLVKENGGYTIVGVTIKHGKLEKWKSEKKTSKSKDTGDSTVQDSTVQDSDSDEYEETDLVIDYLNEKSDSCFQYSKTSRKNIHARLKEGYSVSDLKMIIDHFVVAWDPGVSKRPETAGWLNPTTLFRPSKIEKNINVARKVKKSKPYDPFEAQKRKRAQQ